MMPVAKTEAGLATVMAHEVAHATARHGGETESRDSARDGFCGLGVGYEEKRQKTQSRVLAAYGIGTALVVALPFSRKQESEADRIGLIYMAKAGYDPREAIPSGRGWGPRDEALRPSFSLPTPGTGPG